MGSHGMVLWKNETKSVAIHDYVNKSYFATIPLNFRKSSALRPVAWIERENLSVEDI